MCCEVHESSGGFLHVCAKKNKHDWHHRCACGQSFEEKDTKETEKKFKGIESELYLH